jgi:tetratricopeptide (TPR) repeat protein
MDGALCARAQQAPSFDQLAAQAAAARDQQNLPTAIDLYTQAVKARPEWTEGWWFLTVLQYSVNQYSGAIDAANHVLQLEPHAVPAMALRGLSEFEIADYKNSLGDLETAVEHGAANDPHNEQIVRYHLALDLARAARFQDALDQYKEFAQKGVSDPEMLVAIGLAGMRVTSFPSEIGSGRDRGLYQAAGSAGYAFLAGDTVHADALFQRAFADYPSTPNLHLFYGELLFQHDPDLAAEQFQHEVVVAPASETAAALLAYALVIAGDYKSALPQAQRAYSAAPDMEMAQIALGRSLGETGDLDHGIQILEKVLQDDPGNLEAHMGLAALYARAGRREDAYRERMVCLKISK